MGIADATSRPKRKKKRRSKSTGDAEPKQRSRDVSLRPEYQDLDEDLIEDAEEFARLYDRIKKLEAKKKELGAALLTRIKDGGVKGKFVPLADGRKVKVYQSKGQPKVGKKRLVEGFGQAGAEFWDKADRAPDYEGITVGD